MSNSLGQSIFPPDDNEIGIFDVVDKDNTLRNEYIKNVQIIKDNYFIRSVDKDYILIFGELKEPLHNSDLTVVRGTLNTVRVLKKHLFQLKVVFLVRKTA